MNSNKNFFRKKFLLKREKIPLNDLFNFSFQIINHLKKLPLWKKELYHTFLPIFHKKEINTFPILNYLKKKSKKIVLSKTDFSSGRMNFFIWNNKINLCKNFYGIFEPVDGILINPLLIQVAFIPLLAFDFRGHRLGYGNGFYDRFLFSCSKNIYKIGLCIFDPLPIFLDVHKKDISLDIIVTPNKIYFFN